MHYERLERLAALLDTVPPEKFDLGSWACGTTACAIGWAALDPTFRSEGLRLDCVPSPDTYHCYTVTDLTQTGGTFFPVFGKAVYYAAAEAFWGLTNNQAHKLFAPWSYDPPGTPSDVAKRIRALLAKSKRAPQHEPEVVRALASVD